MATTTAPPKTIQQQPNGVSKQSTPPNQTLFIGNLPTSKISKDDLRRAIYCLFSTHGPVLDVVTMRTKQSRGTAHVVYRDVSTSSQAMRSLQGFEFFGRELKIEYAKGKSSIISRLDGSVRDSEPKTQQATASTALQQSVFNNPNAQLPSKPAAPSAAKAVPIAVAKDKEPQGKEPQGTKRQRDEDEDEGSPMEEDSGGEAMEESDED